MGNPKGTPQGLALPIPQFGTTAPIASIEITRPVTIGSYMGAGMGIYVGEVVSGDHKNNSQCALILKASNGADPRDIAPGPLKATGVSLSVTYGSANLFHYHSEYTLEVSLDDPDLAAIRCSLGWGMDAIATAGDLKADVVRTLANPGGGFNPGSVEVQWAPQPASCGE